MLSPIITFIKKNLTSASTVAFTAALSLKQVDTINLLNLMSADTVMEASRIMIFFLRGAPYVGLFFAQNGIYQRP